VPNILLKKTCIWI